MYDDNSISDVSSASAVFNIGGASKAMLIEMQETLKKRNEVNL